MIIKKRLTFLNISKEIYLKKAGHIATKSPFILHSTTEQRRNGRSCKAVQQYLSGIACILLQRTGYLCGNERLEYAADY